MNKLSYLETADVVDALQRAIEDQDVAFNDAGNGYSFEDTQRAEARRDRWEALIFRLEPTVTEGIRQRQALENMADLNAGGMTGEALREWLHHDEPGVRAIAAAELKSREENR